jgi:lipoprotein signal peptidase
MLYALVTSVALFLGWLAQAIVWGLCYAENSYGMPVCPEWRLARKYSGGAALARLVFANMLGLAYLASLTLAAIAVHRARKPAMDALGCDDGIRMADRNGRLA